jgi:hypothetical protein
MLNNNHHNSNACAFAGQIVSYLYDEAGAKEKTEFETHLNDCATCADELSGFGFVRSSIQEWRSEEIFALEMPALEIPVLAAQKSDIPAETGSWLDGLRRLFSLSPKMAFGSVAFAALVVCAGLTLIILNYSGNETIAEVGAPDSDKILASNKSNSSIEKNVLPQDKPVPDVVKTDTANNQANEKLQPFKKDSSVKASNNLPKNKTGVPKLSNSEASANNLYKKNKTNNVQKNEVPKLSDFDEEEDESLRLADLFAEIDTE